METIYLPKGERSLARLVGFLSNLPKEKAYEVTVKERKSLRSIQQNRYLWGVVYPTILKHLPGWESDDVHEYFLGECFGWETLEGFGRRRLRPIKRSSKLNKQEFGDYVSFIQRKAAELGIFIDDPHEVPV
jgi:hypothetical protein